MSEAQITVIPLSVRATPNPAVNVTIRAEIEDPKARLGFVAAERPLRRTVADILRMTADYYSMPVSELIGPSRGRDIARPRQVAMWICKQITERSTPDIGRRCGGRDHTTVMHAVRRIDELREVDVAIAEACDVLLARLGGPRP